MSSRPNWAELATAAQLVNPHLFRKHPDGLKVWQEALYDHLDDAVESALLEPDLSQLEFLAQLVCESAGTRDMAVLNLLMEIYRALKLQYYDGVADEMGGRRVRRALFQELWHLTRRRIQARLGRDVRAFEHLLYETGAAPDALFSAWSDGSFRGGRGYAGCLLRDPHNRLVAQVSVRIPADCGHISEVRALAMTLRTALAMGVRALKIHVDAAGLAMFAEGTAALKYCVDESVIQQLLQRFEFVRIVKVPRLYNAQADALSKILGEEGKIVLSN